jgi:CRISPR/Cas system-associated exonuclease Cas4 (RecB family)
MQIFSPNMLKTFEDCPKKYEFRYIQKLNVPQKVSMFEKGKKIHALAHYYLRGDDIEKFLPELTPEESEIWQKLLNNEYFQKTYINSEYNLTTRLGKYLIGGRLDAFMKSENNYFILDYKTGAIPENPAEDFQTIIYLICTGEILKKGWGNNFNLSFVYIDLKNNKNHILDFDENKKSYYENKILTACDTITTNKIFEKNNTKCKHCEYSKFCN